MTGLPRIYNIPAGRPFARDLVEGLLQQAGTRPEALAGMRVLLPSRRACRILRECFLQLTDGAPLILPRLLTLGDVEEEELSLQLSGSGNDALAGVDIPPALSPLRRQLILARLIDRMPGYGQDFTHALQLAKALGRFMDQVYTEGLAMQQLAYLVPEEFAAHWQITLEFLQIITDRWPEILTEHGHIDAADRRIRLMQMQAALWQAAPPSSPVIAAGSTGSIPAAAALLGVIAGLPQGCVILPGLDTGLDEESWAAAAEDHPQYGLKLLLQRLGVDRIDVKNWPVQRENETAPARQFLMREMLRPSSTTRAWIELSRSRMAQEQLKAGLPGLSLYTAENEQEEAHTIAILIREALQKPHQTIAVITPCRDLAQRIVALCKKWDIVVDDSAGRSLDRLRLSVFLRLILDVAITDASPLAVLALLKHKYCRLGIDAHRFNNGLMHLEKAALRGVKPSPGFSGIRQKIGDKISDTDRSDAELILNALEAAFVPVQNGSFKKNVHKINILIEMHLRVAKKLFSRNDTDGSENMFFGDDGESIAVFLSDLQAQGEVMPALDLTAYGSVLDALMQEVSVRRAYGTHPNVSILGQIEGRLASADILVLAGLSEGVWPPDAGHDPWMSRAMRKNFGLPGLERSIGLSAHDFAQAFCAPHIILTTSLRRGGEAVLPSRWLQRMESVLMAARLSSQPIKSGEALAWARALHRAPPAEKKLQIKRPEPRPPLSARPRRISVTQVEKWLQNPYAIYARAVLRLRPLEPIDQPFDAALRGSVLHAALHDFIAKYQNHFPEFEEAYTALSQIMRQHLEALPYEEAIWRFWWPRLETMAASLVTHEQAWREDGARPLALEAPGQYEWQAPGGVFTLTAVADRIDMQGGHGVVIDYKTAGNYTKKDIYSGKQPQLLLEGLIAQQGGFKNVPALNQKTAAYWLLSTGAKGFHCITAAEDLPVILAEAQQNLAALVAAYDDPETPYYCQPRPGFRPRFDEYEHLSRIREWGVAGGEDEETSFQEDAA